MTFWLVLAFLAATTALSATAIWRGWRDPANWKLDPVRGRIAFNHWKELALGGLVFVVCAALTLFWMAA